jgi:hypothetical protein
MEPTTPERVSSISAAALSTVLEVLGAVLLLVAAFSMDWRAGTALTGMVLVALGYVTGAPAGGDE